MKLLWYNWALLALLGLVYFGGTQAGLYSFSDSSQTVLLQQTTTLSAGESMVFYYDVNSSTRADVNYLGLQVVYSIPNNPNAYSFMMKTYVNGVEFTPTTTWTSEGVKTLKSYSSTQQQSTFWNCGRNLITLKNNIGIPIVVERVTMGQGWPASSTALHTCSVGTTTTTTTTLIGATTTTVSSTTTTTVPWDLGNGGFLGLDKSGLLMFLAVGFVLSLFWPRKVI